MTCRDESKYTAKDWYICSESEACTPNDRAHYLKRAYFQQKEELEQLKTERDSFVAKAKRDELERLLNEIAQWLDVQMSRAQDDGYSRTPYGALFDVSRFISILHAMPANPSRDSADASAPASPTCQIDR